MKIFLKLVQFSVIALFITGCAKTEKIEMTSTSVGHSRITNFPLLSLLGDDYMAVPVGGTFTEPGADATIGGEAVAYTTEGTVDLTTAGVYALTYTAKNADGFSVSATRFVAVYSTDASAAANDFSGNYRRPATGVVNTWVKLAPGVYKVINPGGAPGQGLIAVLFNPTGTTIFIPEQPTNDGNTTASNSETYTVGTPSTYTMRILNPGYGTAIRSFVKL
ncbi:MAG TPA: DUF5011 domain-containing protein [Ferruginibacter sp.]|nr:DUF5011 domain-containing protein [Ferruginibacter sp.]HPH92340.1 DUF5011 domain-containing protein [Ferruginibacter sp.]